MPRLYLHTDPPSDSQLTTPLNGVNHTGDSGDRSRRMILERAAREAYLEKLDFYQRTMNVTILYTPTYTQRYEGCACIEERYIQAMKSRVQLMIHLRMSMSEVREYIARQRQKMIADRNDYLELITYNMDELKYVCDQFYAIMIRYREKMQECIRNNLLSHPERPFIAYRQGD